ncbi:lipopolysaccharide biosynthesis protein [Bacteroides oleiciplenus]|uniref:Polysaccharide biosynthesis protein C-terminal domain-containing protein n=1 Tax=Bacteroides oleiciplenus YIT 12058 TaxID=742727 RepID=K9E5W0_9BACE|nr:lipopolysaccharide biosynthesis protein [Bacteroides oleiciplenus]EKU91216.1 hypothetical protein HMPREF9447_01406 [Bacteroides oleiciplenus YIT 12058]
MSINRRSVFSSFIWKFLERSSVQVVSFVVTIVLARLLTPEDYGSIALVLVFTNLAAVFVEGGLNSALIQKKDCDAVDYSTILYFSLFVSFIAYLILFFSATALANYYDRPELCPVMRVIGVSLFFNAVNSVQNAYLSKNLLFKLLFKSSFLGVCMSAFVGISMAYLGCGVWALVAQHVVSSFSIMMVMWFTVKWRPVLSFSGERFKVLFNFGWKIFISNFTIALFDNIRSLIIGKMYTPSLLAFFDKGRQFPSLIMNNINSSIQSVMFPVLSIEQDNQEAVKSMMRRSTKVSSYVIFPLLVGMIVIAKPMIILLMTEKWIDAVPFIQIFCVAFMLMPIQNVNLVAIKALGYSDISLKLELYKKGVGTIILIISIFLGIYAIAWGIVVYNFICIIINLYPCRKLLNYSYREQILDVLPSLAISLVMGVAIYGFSCFTLNSITYLSLEIICGAIVYLFLSKIFKLEPFLYLLELSISEKERRGK